MKILKHSGAILVAALAIAACKKEETSIDNQLNEADNNFILLAGINNFTEIQTAKNALLKSADTVVVSFAQQMLTDHEQAQSDLEVMGTIVGFSVKDTIDAAHAATTAQLDTLTGRTFDSVYIHTQLLEHETMINHYADELKNGSQLNVKAYANTNLQNIQLHYQRADSIATAFY